MFEFSRQKVDTKLLENGTLQSMPNQKLWIFDNFKWAELQFQPNLTCRNVNFSQNSKSFWQENSIVVEINPKIPGCKIQNVSTSISIKSKVDETSPDADESFKHLQA